MGLPWLQIWEVTLTIAVLWSTAFTLFIVTLPSRYQPQDSRTIREDDFTDQDKKSPDSSGYTYFQKHKDANNSLNLPTSVQIVVLGDIGRSPRMQYHALSIAQHGGSVQLIGYTDSDIHPAIISNTLITTIPLPPSPKALNTTSKLLFLLYGPLKVLLQIVNLYLTLSYHTTPSKYMLVQNPPSIPTLAITQLICLFRGTRLIIDWHNFGYSILALRLGPSHPLVRISEWYEGTFSRRAFAHFCVTDAMAGVLMEKWGIHAVTLHDRPPEHFQPLTTEGRREVLGRLGETRGFAGEIDVGERRLVVSSTSWTPDEDFGVLLDALVMYSAVVEGGRARLPRLVLVITGKGPGKEFYLERIKVLREGGKLGNVDISTAWLSVQDYASLLGAADLGISLHTSSSGVDLPMKVVDMFGTGLPVAGWSKFKAWPELVTEGQNGRGFGNSEGLSSVLQDLFSDNGAKLQTLRKGAMMECNRRWEDEWMPVAGKLFQLEAE